jgi:arylsulfatase A-like enzyme
MKNISRRDFLKLALAGAGGAVLSALNSRVRPIRAALRGNQPNIILLVLDAMTARNLSLYGYRRKTTPNFERFAERANVYHAHYSAGNFTSPGTASILTGAYPWSHRAINMSSSAAPSFADKHIFKLLGDKYFRLAYTQNVWANFILNPFVDSLDSYLAPGKFSAAEQVLGSAFVNDLNGAYRSYDDFMTSNSDAPGSLLFGTLERLLFRREVDMAQHASRDYPNGLARISNYPIVFRLSDVFDGVRQAVESLPQPFMAYLHLWAPHAPYSPTPEFAELFKDGWKPPKKPLHPLGSGIPQSALTLRRQAYDRYIANVDAEFGRLIDAWERRGILDTTHIIVTSDHGESFERGVDTHITPLLYETLVHIPLMISSPGQTSRQDFFAPTSNVDLLPTLLHLAGSDIPSWTEGRLLPGLGGVEDAQRGIYAVEAKTNSAFQPLTHATFMLLKGKDKLIYNTAYGNYPEGFELFDLENDPEEITNLMNVSPKANAMKEELLAQIALVNSRDASDPLKDIP